MMGCIRRARGVLAVAIAWGGTWGVVGGFVMEGIVDPHGRIVDMWPQLLALSGVVGGLLFSLLLWVSGALAGRRPLAQVSAVHFCGWGAIAGLGVAIIASGGPVSFFVLTLAGTVTAAVTLWVARVAVRRALFVQYAAEGLGASAVLASSQPANSRQHRGTP